MKEVRNGGNGASLGTNICTMTLELLVLSTKEEQFIIGKCL